MSFIQTLIEMGFAKEKAERALEVTNFKGVEPAMEWLLAHSDDFQIPNTNDENNEHLTSTSNNLERNDQGGEDVAGTSNEITNSTNVENEEQQSEAKSLKCDECNKLFTDNSQVEYHAAKTGHISFSESTEEKKPLTEEEKKAQLALIEQKLKQRRAEREEREKQDELEREKNRIKSGKDLTEAKKRMEEIEMKKIIEQRKREKDEEKAARERVRAQIEADKAARKAKLATSEQEKPVSTTTVSSSTSSKPQKDYTNTRIQIRLQDGSTLTETFSVKEQLAAVRTFIQVKQGNTLSFDLMTTFPRKIFSDEDYEKSLEILGLVPSAVITVTRPH